MAQLCWNEIEARATKFASKWHGETYEKGVSHSFWNVPSLRHVRIFIVVMCRHEAVRRAFKHHLIEQRQANFKNILSDREQAIITISHSLTTVEKADVICMMAAGKIIEPGMHKKILNKRGAYCRMFDSQLYASEK